MQMNEGFIARAFREVLGIEIPLPMPRMTFAEAMERYGSDKPDTRFGMEILNISEQVKDSQFVVFKGALEMGGSVRAIVAKGAAETLTRKEIDKLTEHAKGIGAKGLAYVRWVDEAPNCSFAKFMTEDELAAIYAAVGLERGDVMLICADKDKVVLPTLGALRGILARKLDLIPAGKFNFLWITEFPFFEWDEESGTWVAMHHPFTMPLEECLPMLESDPGSVRAKCYDMVLNGTELLSGSIRITDWQLQEKMFKALGLTPEEIEAKFGFLVEAYKYGAPPHAGMAPGIDRMVMLLTDEEKILDVIAFPHNGNAQDLLLGAPSEVTNQQLEDVHLLGSGSALAQRQAAVGGSSKKAQGKRSTFSNAQQLNQLSLTEDEETVMQGIFSAMAENEAKLKDIDTENVEEMVHVMPMTNVLREDVRVQNFSRESLLEGAPERNEDSWQVPRLVK